jgi:hypothetical protein
MKLMLILGINFVRALCEELREFQSSTRLMTERISELVGFKFGDHLTHLGNFKGDFEEATQFIHKTHHISRLIDEDFLATEETFSFEFKSVIKINADLSFSSDDDDETGLQDMTSISIETRRKISRKSVQTFRDGEVTRRKTKEIVQRVKRRGKKKSS